MLMLDLGLRRLRMCLLNRCRRVCRILEIRGLWVARRRAWTEATRWLALRFERGEIVDLLQLRAHVIRDFAPHPELTLGCSVAVSLCLLPHRRVRLENGRRGVWDCEIKSVGNWVGPSSGGFWRGVFVARFSLQSEGGGVAVWRR